MDPQYRAKAGRDKCQPTAPDPKPQKTTAPDPQKLGEGSPRPCRTTGSPATLPLMNRHPLFGTDPPYTAMACRDNFHRTAPDPKPRKTTTPDPQKLEEVSPQLRCPPLIGTDPQFVGDHHSYSSLLRGCYCDRLNV